MRNIGWTEDDEKDYQKRHLEEEKSRLEATGGWTGPTNRQLNTMKSTESIQTEIAARQAQGKPTQQLQDELNSRR